jgi:dephospho-CoA kinase
MMLGNGLLLDKILVVTASLAVRMKRIRRRDERSDEEIRAIIARQLSDEERLSFADFVIDNDENTAVLPQVLALYTSLKTV